MIAVRASETAAADSSAPRPATWAQPREALLRRVLVAADLLTVAATWTVLLGPLGALRGTGGQLLISVAAITFATVAFMSSQQLYLARVCRHRSVEVSRILRISVLVALAVHLVGPRWDVALPAWLTIAAVGGVAANLSLTRGAYNLWLQRRRASGRHSRPVVVVGPRDEAEAIDRLLTSHPEVGFQAVALVGPAGDVMQGLQEHGSDTVVVASCAFTGAEINKLTRRLLDAGVHVHLSTGLTGIDQRRLRAQPMAREPMFYLEPLRITPAQRALKRTVDVAGSIIGLVIALPVLLVAAIAIKIEDRGPVLYRHKRVGRNGDEFTILKLRTMVQDAERQLHLVAADNQRTGPLYKSHNDPRVTRVGRWLRASSIDELPQLINVLLGAMSLVGPRPALAHEVAQFDSELRSRERVRPGITGLWQIEGRDDPSFDAYRRLDLFYVENWSLELDLIILLSTFRAVFVQALRDRRRQWRQEPERPVSVIDLVALESAQ